MLSIRPAAARAAAWLRAELADLHAAQMSTLDSACAQHMAHPAGAAFDGMHEHALLCACAAEGGQHHDPAPAPLTPRQRVLLAEAHAEWHWLAWACVAVAGLGAVVSACWPMGVA